MLRNGTRTKTGRTGKQQQQKRLLSYVEEGDNKLGCRHVDKTPQCRCPPGWRVRSVKSQGLGSRGRSQENPQLRRRRKDQEKGGKKVGGTTDLVPGQHRPGRRHTGNQV